MQLAATRPGTKRDEIAAPVTIRLLAVEARGAVQRQPISCHGIGAHAEATKAEAVPRQPDSMNRNAKERGQIRAMGQGRALQLLYRQAADQDLPERAR